MIFVAEQYNDNFRCDHNCQGKCKINSFYNHEVKLWGSWDCWKSPISSEYVESDYTHMSLWNYFPKGYKFKRERFTALVPEKLSIGVYEYKWQFINKTTGKSFWLCNSSRKIRHNDGWNSNNLFVVNKN